MRPQQGSVFQDKLPFTFSPPPVGAGPSRGPAPTLLTRVCRHHTGRDCQTRGVRRDCPGKRVSGWDPPLGLYKRRGRAVGVTGYSQHSMGLEATCSDSVRPLGCGMCTRNTSLTRVFFLPMSVSPLRSSMSEFRSFRIPAQSMLPKTEVHCLPVPLHEQDARPRRSTRPSPQGRTATPCRQPR